MTELLSIPLKISLVIFMAGNLLDMGLRLNPGDALRGLRNARFVAYTVLWGFVLGPALAYGITLVIPLAAPYAIGLILLSMTPCAPFLPILADKAKGRPRVHGGFHAPVRGRHGDLHASLTFYNT